MFFCYIIWLRPVACRSIGPPWFGTAPKQPRNGAGTGEDEEEDEDEDEDDDRPSLDQVDEIDGVLAKMRDPV